VDVLLDLLWTHTWWIYDPSLDWSQDPWSIPYRCINLLEGAALMVFAGLVLRRASNTRIHAIELAYAAAFVAFALTDFREAYALQSWLIWVKATNLVVLLQLRRRVIRQYYPASRTY